MKTVERLLKRFADRLEPVEEVGGIWNEGDDGWWASLKTGWMCRSTQTGSCHERTLRELEAALKAAQSPDDVLMQPIVRWFKAEYARRTRAVEDGTARIDWLDPGTRVSFSEVCAKAEELGITENPVALRVAFDKLLSGTGGIT